MNNDEIEKEMKSALQSNNLMAWTHEQIKEMFGHPKRQLTNPQTFEDLQKPIIGE